MSRALRLASLLAVAAPVPLAAQRLLLTGEGFNAQHRVLYQGSVSERSGMLLGGAAALRLGPVVLRLGTTMGSLGASQDSANPETKVRASSIRLGIRATPWAEVGAEAEARRFDGGAGITVWRMYGATVRLTPAMGMAGLSGVLEATMFPSASVTTGESLSPAMRGTVGVSYQSPQGVIGLLVGYRFERFDFSTSGSARLEQFRGIVAGATVRLGR